MHFRTIAILSLAILPAVASAQGGQAPGDPAARRERMEQQLRQGIWRVAKARVGLTDDQMRKLEATSLRFDARRRALNTDEHAQRRTLRSELALGDGANQDRVGGALDRLMQLQRQRLDIVADEQKELATFMTPVQRARYSALQDQLRRRMDTMRRGRPGGGGRPPR